MRKSLFSTPAKIKISEHQLHLLASPLPQEWGMNRVSVSIYHLSIVTYELQHSLLPTKQAKEAYVVSHLPGGDGRVAKKVSLLCSIF